AEPAAQASPSLAGAADAEIAGLCADHLRMEESLLTAVLPILDAVQAIHGKPALTDVPTLVKHHHELTQLIDLITRKRHSLRSVLAERLGIAAAEVRLNRILDCLPAHVCPGLHAQLDLVRGLAEQL